MTFEMLGISLPELDAIDLDAVGFELTNREIASLIYIGMLLIALLVWKQGRHHIGDLIKAFFHPILSVIWILMTVFTVACVFVLSAINAWEWENLKTTLIWWISVGFASMWQSQKVAEERGAFNRLLRDTINITVVILFLAEVKSFPLWAELILLPVLTILAVMLAIAQTQRESAILVGPLQSILTLIGLFVLWNGLSGILEAPAEFFTWDTVREFSAPIFLSLMFVPFIYGLAVWIAHESIFTRAKFLGQDSPNTGYARWMALLAFGVDIGSTKRFSRELRANALSSRAEIKEAIQTIRRLKKREAAPPTIAASEGWSPYEAMTWLNTVGIYTDDWHGSAYDNEWTAAAYSVAISDRPLPDFLSYYVTGIELAATRLRLSLDASRPNDPAASDEAFYDRAHKLVGRVFGEANSDRLVKRIRSRDQDDFHEDGFRVIVDWNGVGENACFGYQRNLKIIHPAHCGAD